MTDPQPNQGQESVDVDNLSSVQRLYINGFTVGTSLSDIFVIADTAGVTSAMLLMSFTTAKTLVQELGRAVTTFEEMTGRTLLTMDDIQKARAAKEGKKAEE